MTNAYDVMPARDVSLKIGDLVSPSQYARRQLEMVTKGPGLGLITKVGKMSGLTQIVYVWWFNTPKPLPISSFWLEVHRAS
jgi:hypothetical protein